MQQTLSVTQVNEYIRGVMDNDLLLCNLAVKGEISNYKVYPSGHHYFSLKDDGGAIRCVMFRGNATKLRFRPDNGMQVIAIGKISVYPRDGAYQLYCTAMVVDGVGDLHAAFEQLKKKLAEQGLFDPEHKKKLPIYPGRIGIITSSAGAAIHDMLRILNKRYPLTEVKLLPVRVQGNEAPGEIAAAIEYANRIKLADVLIVGRGGGSVEDLWAFNEEIVAHAIYRSKIPVISAVGHEPDITISDYVADMRAATPSNAAEIVVPDQDVLRQNLDSATKSMASALLRQIKNARSGLKVLSESPVLQDPTQYFTIRRNNLVYLQNRLTSAYSQSIHCKVNSFTSLTAKLDAMSPLKVLTRGYSVTSKSDGSLVRSITQTQTGDNVHIQFYDGSLTANITEIKEQTK